MSTTSLHTQGASNISTSTSDLITVTHAAVQTEDSYSTDSDSETSDNELEASAAEGGRTEEETLPKRFMTSEEDDEAEGRSREAPATEINISSVDKVEIVHGQRTINNNYVVENFTLNWDNFDEEIICERIEVAQRRTEQQVQSMERRLKKEMKESKAMSKALCQRQLLQWQASDAALKEQLKTEMAQQRKEFARKQQEMVELQKETLDQLAKIAVDQEEARRKEKEAQSYTFKLGGKQPRVLEHVWSGLKESQLVQLMKRLYQKFKIKLRQIGINRGIKFVVDIPPENVEAFAKQQAAIQETIMEEILPVDVQTEITWEPAVPVFGEAELNPPVQVSEVQGEASTDASSSNNLQTAPTNEPLQSYDPMTAIPELMFQVKMTDDDFDVSSLLITKNKLVIMANYNNHNIICMPLDSPRVPNVSIRLKTRPEDMTEYKHGVIAVTTARHIIFMVEVRRDTVSIVKEVTTTRKYTGVASFGDDEILVVSTKGDHLGLPTVDVITEEGKLLWTVANAATHPDLDWPFNLYMQNHEVLVADLNGLIHRMDVTSGTSYPALKHPDLQGIVCRITADVEGHVYVVNYEKMCVSVYSMSTDQWRQLLTGHEYSAGERDIPRAVGVTQDGVMVVFWQRPRRIPSVLHGYALKSGS